MQDGVQALVEKRMNKALGVILGMKEHDVDEYLPPDVAARLRRVVLEQFNEFLDVVCDVLESMDNGTVTLNDHWLSLLEEIHTATVRPEEPAQPAEPQELGPYGRVLVR